MGKKSREDVEPVEVENKNGDGHVDELDDSEEFDESDLVTITDEEGKSYECAILGVLEHEDAEYALLAPVDQLSDDDGDAVEMFIFLYEVDDEGNQTFSYIEDDALYEVVKDEFALLVNQDE
jgi:uncharacterized protein YrzB (UPF0473 family)